MYIYIFFKYTSLIFMTLYYKMKEKCDDYIRNEKVATSSVTVLAHFFTVFLWLQLLYKYDFQSFYYTKQLINVSRIIRIYILCSAIRFTELKVQRIDKLRFINSERRLSCLVFLAFNICKDIIVEIWLLLAVVPEYSPCQWNAYF